MVRCLSLLTVVHRAHWFTDYKRTQKVLSSCQFCYGEDDSPPKAPVIAMGTRAYLSCTLNEELVPGHCLIVPIQHHLTMLEGDDDVWDEVRVCIFHLNTSEAGSDRRRLIELYEVLDADVL
jgi:Protein similar to CwfJ C-terminus 1.